MDAVSSKAVVAITGMTGALISLPAMKELPFGIPKLLISGATGQPVHAAKFGDYFARSNITVMHTVVDTVGMNPLVRTLALNGADAISGMVEGGPASLEGEKPSIAMTEFGYCDKGAYHIREILEGDYEIVSIHAMGVGDKAALDLAPQGVFKAFVDLVPGAFSEHLLGGNRDAGPDRLDVAATLPIPYIFCPGGFDMISCGPIERRDNERPSVDIAKIGREEALPAAAASAGQNEPRGDGAGGHGRRGEVERLPEQGACEGGHTFARLLVAERGRRPAA